jgi:hypothetical protein
MPKNISVALKGHLAQAVTTLATCWRIVALNGFTVGFTTFDRDLNVLGVRYQSVSGFSQTAVQSGTTGQVDNLQVLGFFSPDGIHEADVKNGLYDYASVFLFLVNWGDLTQGQLNLRRGWLGETVAVPNGAFAAELRGINQALVQEFGNFYSPLCRNDLGDMNCKIPILPPLWQPGWTVGNGQYVRQLTASTDDLKTAIYQAKNGGTTWATEPIWSPAWGTNTYDNDIVWVSKTPYRLIAYVVAPIDQHNFQSTPLAFPASAETLTGTIGQILVFKDVSAGSALEVSDGVNTWTWSFAYDYKTQDAFNAIWNGLHSSGLNATITQIGPANSTTLQIEIHTGKPGSITKTGDILGGLIIDNFGDTFLDGGVITWDTGFNAGVSVELKTYNTSSDVVTTYLGIRMAVTVGDRFFYHPGCDKRRDTCVRKYNNIVNFRAEPDMPGIDRMLTYPDAG